MDRSLAVQRVSKSRTRLSDFHFLLRPCGLESTSQVAYEKLRPGKAEGFAWAWDEWQELGLGLPGGCSARLLPAAPERA